MCTSSNCDVCPLQSYTEAGIASWSGNDDEAHAARHDHGAVGVISVTSNVVPGLFAHMMRERDDAQNDALQVRLCWLVAVLCLRRWTSLSAGWMDIQVLKDLRPRMGIWSAGAKAVTPPVVQQARVSALRTERDFVTSFRATSVRCLLHCVAGPSCQDGPTTSESTTTAQAQETLKFLTLQELIAWMFAEPNPIAVNTTLAMCGLVKPVFRLPYVPLSAAQRAEGAKLLRPLLEHIPGAERIEELADDDFTVLANF